MKRGLVLGLITCILLASNLNVHAEKTQASQADLEEGLIVEDFIEEDVDKPYKKLFSLKELNSYKKDDIQMLPLRKVAEKLGFQVKWNRELRQVDVFKDAMSTSLKSGKNYYIIAREAPRKLSVAPENIGGQIFVPLEFFEEILGHRLIVAGDELAILMDKEEETENNQLYMEGYAKQIINGSKDLSILMSVDTSDIELTEIYLHIVDDTEIEDETGKKIGVEEIKVGDRLKVNTPRFMSMSLPPQTIGKTIRTNKFIEIETKEKNNIFYPEISYMEDPVVKSYFQQHIVEVLSDLEDNEIYRDLEVKYQITYLDNSKISIVFIGTYDFLGQSKTLIRNLNIDLKTGDKIDFNSYFKQDKESQKELKRLLNQAARVQQNKDFEAEGLGMYFTEDFLVVYYYELDDSVSVPTELYLYYNDIEGIIEKNK